MARNARDHGGGLDAAIAQFGGKREDWIDLSTGINPRAFPVPSLTPDAWGALPDQAANDRIINAARAFWTVPDDAAILPVPGCSSAIVQIPHLSDQATIDITGPTYNEHAASFGQAGWQIVKQARHAQARVIVHPNNPTGEFHARPNSTKLTIIDESFCDVAPDHSLIQSAALPGHLVLKSFGKFWGLAGLRLGFVIGDPALVAQLAKRLGPWPVSGIALEIGATALKNNAWADETRAWLSRQINQLDRFMTNSGCTPMGDVSLFRTYQIEDAKALQTKLAQHKIWTRVFPYCDTWIRLGLPTDAALKRLGGAL